MRAESACGPSGTRRKADARDRREETGSHRSAGFNQLRKRPRGSAWCQHCRGQRAELVGPPHARARGPRLTLGQGELGRAPSASLCVGFCSAASGPEPRLPGESPSQTVRPAPQTPPPTVASSHTGHSGHSQPGRHLQSPGPRTAGDGKAAPQPRGAAPRQVPGCALLAPFSPGAPGIPDTPLNPGLPG